MALENLFTIVSVSLPNNDKIGTLIAPDIHYIEPTAASVSEMNSEFSSLPQLSILPSASRLPMSEYTDYNPPSESQLISAIRAASRASSCVNSPDSETITELSRNTGISDNTQISNNTAITKQSKINTISMMSSWPTLPPGVSSENRTSCSDNNSFIQQIGIFELPARKVQLPSSKGKSTKDSQNTDNTENIENSENPENEIAKHNENNNNSCATSAHEDDLENKSSENSIFDSSKTSITHFPSNTSLSKTISEQKMSKSVSTPQSDWSVCEDYDRTVAETLMVDSDKIMDSTEIRSGRIKTSIGQQESGNREGDFEICESGVEMSSKILAAAIKFENTSLADVPSFMTDVSVPSGHSLPFSQNRDDVQSFNQKLNHNFNQNINQNFSRNSIYSKEPELTELGPSDKMMSVTDLFTTLGDATLHARFTKGFFCILLLFCSLREYFDTQLNLAISTSR